MVRLPDLVQSIYVSTRSLRNGVSKCDRRDEENRDRNRNTRYLCMIRYYESDGDAGPREPDKNENDSSPAGHVGIDCSLNASSSRPVYETLRVSTAAAGMPNSSARVAITIPRPLRLPNSSSRYRTPSAVDSPAIACVIKSASVTATSVGDVVCMRRTTSLASLSSCRCDLPPTSRSWIL